MLVVASVYHVDVQQVQVGLVLAAECVWRADTQRHPEYEDRAAGHPPPRPDRASRKSPAPLDNTRACPAVPSRDATHPRRGDAPASTIVAAPTPAPLRLCPPAQDTAGPMPARSAAAARRSPRASHPPTRYRSRRADSLPVGPVHTPAARTAGDRRRSVPYAPPARHSSRVLRDRPKRAGSPRVDSLLLPSREYGPRSAGADGRRQAGTASRAAATPAYRAVCWRRLRPPPGRTAPAA